MNKRQAKKVRKKEKLQQSLCRKQDEEYSKRFNSALKAMMDYSCAMARRDCSEKPIPPTVEDLKILCNVNINKMEGFVNMSEGNQTEYLQRREDGQEKMLPAAAPDSCFYLEVSACLKAGFEQKYGKEQNLSEHSTHSTFGEELRTCRNYEISTIK